MTQSSGLMLGLYIQKYAFSQRITLYKEEAHSHFLEHLVSRCPVNKDGFRVAICWYEKPGTCVCGVHALRIVSLFLTRKFSPFLYMNKYMKGIVLCLPYLSIYCVGL